MKKNLHLILISAFLLNVFSWSCKKDDNVKRIVPNASFRFRDIEADSFKMGTGDTITLINNSNITNSVHWDLGNGTVAKSKNVLCSYSKSGTYNITLTVKSEDGDSSIIKKKIIIVDWVLKKIIINSVFWDTKPNNIDHFNYWWPTTNTATVLVKLQKYNDGDVISNGLLINSPVLYSSNPILNVSNSTTIPIEIQVSNKVILDKKMILDRTVVLALIAKDGSGKEYNLMSNRDSGSSWQIEKDDIGNNVFNISCKLFSAVELIGAYE